MNATYTLTVYVTCPVDSDDDSDGADYIGRQAQRNLEREVLRALRVLDASVDCECMAAELETKR